MIELPRAILLPPPESAGPSGRARPAGMAPWVPALPVRAATRVPDATVENAPDAGPRYRGPALDHEPGAAGADGRRRAPAGLRIGDAMAGPAAAAGASAAFLAQQIFQEAMQSGLHLEPWGEGIGAYRRAGAAPPIEDGSAALFSVAV